MKLYNDDCLKVLPTIFDKSINLILTDPPYGATQCKWDSIIPFEPMWKELKRIIKENGCIALFGSEPFSSYLRTSNIDWFKYDWIWKKNYITGQFLAKKQPLRNFEIISIFYKKQCFYNRQMVKKTKDEFKKSFRVNSTVQGKSNHLKNEKNIRIRSSIQRQWLKPPNQIINFSCDRKRNNNNHPTQKPIALLEYLIKTYTNENDTVLDFTMGSGSTGLACKNLNRNFIGIELDNKYFEIAKNRIESTLC